MIDQPKPFIGFCPLASGSKGNSIYVGTETTKILIDAGLSGKMTKTRLEQLGVDIADIDAILVTHDHVDHIQGIKVLAQKYNLPIIANSATAKGILSFCSFSPQFKIFATGESFAFGDLEIHPFSIQHDTLDPVAFTIQAAGMKLGFCADLGFVTTPVKHHLRNCDYLYVEANHEPSMVHASPRPMIYKQRVLGRTGHLSNASCAELLLDVAHPGLKGVQLAHLSGECNAPAKALEVVGEMLERRGIRLNISIAPQHAISVPVAFT